MASINTHVINILKEQLGDADIVQEIIKVYLSSTPSRFDCIRQALAENKIQQASQEAHTLKSSSRSLGAEKLGELCQALEDLKDSQNILQANNLFTQIESEYLAVCRELNDLSRA